MSILADLESLLRPLGIPLETGVFKGKAPDIYIVMVPLTDTYALHADNTPGCDIQEVRLSLYAKGNYLSSKRAVLKALLDKEYTITDRRYLGYETETGYHHYAVDVANYYEMEE